MMILGVDPGVSTGIAIYRGGELILLETIHPAYIGGFINESSGVVFEDSRLQSRVWSAAASKAASCKIARNVGEIDAWCRLITELCERKGIPALGISPKAKGAKMDADAFAKLTGWDRRSNQHERDAAAVSWRYRNGWQK
ncbi:MAG: hypothetical protein RL535_1511 [Pseudomonadota bacterium]|jgi:hypothetical protein